jgi:hypothetical protein
MDLEAACTFEMRGTMKGAKLYSSSERECGNELWRFRPTTGFRDAQILFMLHGGLWVSTRSFEERKCLTTNWKKIKERRERKKRRKITNSLNSLLLHKHILRPRKKRSYMQIVLSFIKFFIGREPSVKNKTPYQFISIQQTFTKQLLCSHLCARN